MNRATRIAGLIFAGLTIVAQPALAWSRHADHGHSDYARVIDSEPIYEYVDRPRRECRSEWVGQETAYDRSYAGAVIGGIAGGILGNQVGQGSGKAIATAIGAATGAIVGDGIDNRDGGRAISRPVYEQRCRSVTSTARYLVGYDVTYRYRGRDYTTFMRQAPGEHIRVGADIPPYDD